MRIEYNDTVYEFEWTSITVKQAIKIEKYLGCPISEFGEKLSPAEPGKEPDMAAIQVLGWLILHDGRGIPIEDADFNLAGFMNAMVAGAAAEAEAAGEVPTVAAEPSSANGSAPAAVPATGASPLS